MAGAPISPRSFDRLRRRAIAGAVLACAVAVVVAASGVSNRLMRIVMPGERASGFEIVVTSGDAVIRRGEAVTLTAYPRPLEPTAQLPDSAVLVIRSSPGAAEERQPMIGGTDGAFHVTRPHVEADFEYRVEAGGAASDGFTVLVADPVELSSETAFEITPPAYTSFPARSLSGFTAFDARQHSTAAFRFCFTRPAEAVALDWRPDSRAFGEEPDPVPVELTADRLSATAAFPLRANGTLRLTLTNEIGPRRLRTEVAVPVQVLPDEPPRFERIAGVMARPCAVRPGERVSVGFVAVDDVRVQSAVIEYTIGPDPANVARLPIPMTEPGPRAEGWTLFDPGTQARNGDTIRYRVRVADGRRVDAAKLGPQEAVYPPSGWAELRLTATAPPLDRQDIFGRRDELHQAFAALQTEVNECRTEAASLQADAAGPPPWPVDRTVRLDRLRERVGTLAIRFRNTAREVRLTFSLRSLAASLDDTANQPLRATAEALWKAVTDQPADRRAALTAAHTQLDDAAERIADLLRRNDHFAQARLDRRRLNALIADQIALAEQVKTGAVSGKEGAATQRELLDRLNRTVAESEPLTHAVAAAVRRDRAVLAADVRAFAGWVRDQNADAARLAADTRQVLLRELVQAQTAFAERAAAFYPRIDTAARLTQAKLPGSADFRRIAGMLEKAQTVEALVELEAFAQSLERVAGEFDKLASDRTDPKASVRQIARWQDDLRARVAAVTRAVPFAQLPDPVQDAIRVEQRAILRAVARLRFPPAGESHDLHEAAQVHLRLAMKAADADGTGFDAPAQHAVDTLARLADKSPTAAERLTRARPELDRLRLEQDQVAALADSVLRPLDKTIPTPPVIQGLVPKLAAARERQHQLADRLAALDLPGQEARQTRTEAALRTAAADLKAGLPLDAAASLADAKRELDRLRQALEKGQPADDKAAELARRQAALADAFVGAVPTAKHRDALAASQADILKELARLAAPEAPVLLNEAQDAARQADHAFHTQSDRNELRTRTRAAAETLARLADRIAGRETERNRLNRLAENRRQAVCDARRLAGKPYNPDASGEARRQLDREAEELLHTRVGTAGQIAKRKTLDAYARLRQKTEPDRQPTDQKQLAEMLDELAATLPEKFAPPTRPAEVDPAEAYLPSKPLAEALRAMARDQRSIRERITALKTDVARTVGASAEATRLQERQRELAQAAGELAGRIEHAAQAAPPGERERHGYEAAAILIRKGQAVLAETGQPRQAAEPVFQQAAELLTAANRLPAGGNHPTDAAMLATGNALREAERAMRSAIAAQGDRPTAERAMRYAAEMLERTQASDSREAAVSAVFRNAGEPQP